MGKDDKIRRLALACWLVFVLCEQGYHVWEQRSNRKLFVSYHFHFAISELFYDLPRPPKKSFRKWLNDQCLPSLSLTLFD